MSGEVNPPTLSGSSSFGTRWGSVTSSKTPQSSTDLPAPAIGQLPDLEKQSCSDGRERLRSPRGVPLRRGFEDSVTQTDARRRHRQACQRLVLWACAEGYLRWRLGVAPIPIERAIFLSSTGRDRNDGVDVEGSVDMGIPSGVIVELNRCGDSVLVQLKNEIMREILFVIPVCDLHEVRLADGEMDEPIVVVGLRHRFGPDFCRSGFSRTDAGSEHRLACWSALHSSVRRHRCARWCSLTVSRRQFYDRCHGSGVLPDPVRARTP